MDTVARRRRGSLGVGELEAESIDREVEFQTALGQGGSNDEALGGFLRGDASPGTMESGGAVGPSTSTSGQLPVANPFHSDRVKSEVQLLRNRPATLDEDAARLQTEVDDMALGDAAVVGGNREPDYGLFLGPAGEGMAAQQPVAGTSSNVPRVARVESAGSAPSLCQSMGTEWKPEVIREGVATRNQESELRRVVQSGSGEDPEAGIEEEQRELIPVEEDRLSRVESLLAQVLQENESLRRQVQAESNSSFQSARTPADQPASPMSFGYGRFMPEVTPSSFPDVQPQDRRMPNDFPGGCQAGWFVGSNVIPGAPHAVVRARPPQVPFMGPPGIGFKGQEFGASGLLQGGFSGCGFGDHLEPRPAPPPVPVPVPPNPETQVSVPQTMKQFTSAAMIAGWGQGEVGQAGFHTPRSGCGNTSRFDAEGYPVSPGGTSIKPPSLPPPASPRDPLAAFAMTPSGLRGAPWGSSVPNAGFESGRGLEKPEEPARYIDSLPKLAQVDLSTSAVTCGNWLAQVKQIFVGLSPGAVDWYARVEGAAYESYHRWLMADPLGRLSVDPSSVVAGFDAFRFQRVESRAVTLLLAALPASVKDDLVMNRWLSSAAILFRVLCIWQPGGSNERAHLLSQLVQPEVCRSFKEALPVLRRWQQNLQRAREIQASLPDASLLIKGVDQATSTVLTANPMIGFRVNAFRHRSGLDYNPSTAGVVQLVRLIQAEFEAASLIAEGSSEKRPRNAAASAALPRGENPTPPATKAGAEVPPSVARVQSADREAKGGKAKGKGKGDSSSAPLCHKFTDGTGCRFGDSCLFKHDRSKARRDGRCLACGQSGHYRPECGLVAPENRVVPDSGSEASPSSGNSAPAKGSGKAKAKAKSGAQAKGITEDARAEVSATQGSTPSGGAGTPAGPEALVAEAAKLLKNVSLRPLRVEDVDLSWVRSALTSASDPSFCLIDSGATNALRPAGREELSECKTIKVDLASGETELRINGHGTLLHGGDCQVILPAQYLVDLGYNIVWRRKGCKVKHPKRGGLQVTLVKGCPLIPREVGLQLLQEYENKRPGLPVLSKTEVQDLVSSMSPEELRLWMKERVKGGNFSEVDQLVFLRTVFPRVPLRVLIGACAPRLNEKAADWSELPWNRRFRRSVSRAPFGSVLLAVSPFMSSWKGLGPVVQVADSEKGLGSQLVFQLVMSWAEKGVLGGFVKGEHGHEEAKGSQLDPTWDYLVRTVSEQPGDCSEEGYVGLVRFLRFLLAFAVAQASRDIRDSEASCDSVKGAESPSPTEVERIGGSSPSTRIKVSEGRELGEGSRFSDLGSRVFLVCGSGLGPLGQSSGDTRDVLGLLKTTYGLCQASFDQGCLGAPGVYASRIVTSSWFLYENLHQVKATAEERASLVMLQEHCPEGCGLNKCGWIGNVVRVFQDFWVRWKLENRLREEVLERQVLLKKLSDEERYAQHVGNDHVPYMKGCPVCIAAQGRQRSHWRSSYPGVHSLSVDISGPFVFGKSWDVEASGRDKGGKYRYFLAGAYSVPTTFVKGAEEADVDCDDYEPSECGYLQPQSAVAEGELESIDDLFKLPGEASEVGLRAVTHRIKGKSREVEGSGEEKPNPVPKDTGCSYRTLFVGVPLRSKRGKEVLGQIQGMINKLEATGFPVQRYHADRAKELRSEGLVSWLKDRGIHCTWTAGESPAGNRAELSVQSLKGFTRKLLGLSGVSREYWPLALIHASTRNWINFVEAAGISQPPLLPFGVKIHAHKRMRSGYDSQWESKTIEGVYLGHAPNTPGGHLVLVPDLGEHKVLLTNTVYPLKGQASETPKPKYKLVGKRSPTFAVRVVAASLCEQDCIASVVTRSQPGGESLSSGDEFFEMHRQGSEDSEQSQGELLEVGLEGTGVYVQGGLDFGDEVESGLLLAANSVLVDGEEVNLEAEDSWCFSEVECLKVLEGHLGSMPVAKRLIMSKQGRAVVLGLYGVGGFHGISRAAEERPEVTRYLNAFVRHQNPDHLWTTLYVSRNTLMPLHRDLRNAKGSQVLVRAVGNFVGGGLWVEGDANSGVSCKTLPGGSRRFGQSYDIHSEALVFSGEKWHVPEEWDGDVRWVIAAFTPRLKGTRDEHWSVLRSLAFPVDGVLSGLGSEGAVRSLLTTGEQLYEEDCLGSDKVLSASLEEWEIGLPISIADDDVVGGFVRWHEGSARLCRLLSEELGGAVGDVTSVTGVHNQLRRAEELTEWLEDCLQRVSGEPVFSTGLKALHPDIPLTEGLATSDTFLQTRTVGLAEARKELTCWKEPAQEEVSSLETVNQAVERVSASTVEEWVAQGLTVVQLPGKAVLTRKSGTGKRRFRAVCCGNHLPTDKLGLTREELYASGAESLTVKVAITFAARHPEWSGVTIDVKSAFLYAPIRSDTKGTEERIIVKPPFLLVELGLLKQEDRWWIRKALYGLPTSPRDWGRYRDAEFAKVRMRWQGREFQLFQTKTDDALWLLREASDGTLGPIEGVLVVYVDDLAVFAPEGLAKEFIAAVQAKWKTSQPEWLGRKAVTFCGLELALLPSGYRMSQRAYIKEILNRYNVEESAPVPILKWVEPEPESDPSIDKVREAQGLTGALLWVSTRTRPDLAYVVSRCGQQATKAPQWSISAGRQALAYLKGTLDLSIEVPFAVGNPFSEHGLLATPRTDKVLEVYTDASHSPGGDRSMQSVFIVWRGVPLAWEANRQPFTTLSSAESELVCMVHGVQLAEAVQPLVDELLGDDSLIALLADNEAAIRSFETASTGWRNRHLRMRAVAGRERVEAGLLRVSHLPGEYQLADLGTKPLARSRIMQLLELLSIRGLVGDRTGDARALSRLTLTTAQLRSESAELLAGLALLAAIPKVTGQPTEDRLEQSSGWLFWSVGVAVTLACAVWGWWLMFGWSFRRQGEGSFGNSVDSSCSEGSALSLPVNEETALAHDREGLASELQTVVALEPGEDDRSSPEEWEQAQDHLRKEELRVGLTLVQRARVRRAISRGGIVDPPAFQQRYGPLPEWYAGVEPSAPSEIEPSAPSELEPLAPSEVPPVVNTPRVGPNATSDLWEHHGDLLSAFLGVPTRDWACLAVVSRTWGRNTRIVLLLHLQDTGRFNELSGFQVQLRYADTETGSSWEPISVVGWVPQSGQASSSTEAVGTPLTLGTQSLHGQASSSTDAVHAGDVSGALGFQGDSAGLDVGAPSPAVQIGGSSSSHGVSTTDWGCYEDSFEQPQELSRFPLVGTWLVVHFLVQLLSCQGHRILWFLGEGSWDWLMLRVTSASVRWAIVGALADVWRQGPNYYMFDGPQWQAAVEDHLCVRLAVQRAERRRIGQVGSPRPVEQSVPVEADNASDGEDEEIDDRPHRDPPGVGRRVMRLVDPSSSSESESSTTEPSHPESEIDVSDREPPQGSLGLAGVSSVVPSVAYSAGNGALRVHYVDDSFDVPLEGWTEEGIQSVVEGLQSGLWPDWSQAIQSSELSNLLSVPGPVSEAHPGNVGLAAAGFGGVCSFWFRVLVLYWVCVLATQGSASSELEALVLATSSDSVCSQGLQVRSGTREVGGPGIPVDCDGSTLMYVIGAVTGIIAWEIMRWLFRCCWPSARQLTIGCQTNDFGIIPLPLPVGVPYRARILYSFWRAGFKIDTDAYPEKVQDEVCWLIGDYLKRLEDGGSPHSDFSGNGSEVS